MFLLLCHFVMGAYPFVFRDGLQTFILRLVAVLLRTVYEKV